MTNAQIIITSCNRRGLELEQMRDFLEGNGLQVFDEDWSVDRRSDLIFLSTCGFTQAAEDFGFETLHRINREKKPSAQVVMCGCIPEINPARVNAEFGGVTFSPQSYSKLDDIISAQKHFDSFKRPNLLRQKRVISDLRDDLKKGIQLITTFDGSFSGLQYLTRKLGNGVARRIIRGRYANIDSTNTFYIQIQEGCSMGCSYCSIKTAIGALRSKPLESILQDFRTGLELGYQEFQLVGDNAGSYGLDIGTSLHELLDELSRFEEEFRLDLTDIHPVYLNPISEAVIELGSKGRLARLYVPIQSGSSRILKLMKRGCDMDRVKDTLKTIKGAVPPGNHFWMGTSIIVGFPSETAEELQQTIDFCREVDFDWVWCHSFSARPETPAAGLNSQIEPDEILRRARSVKEELSSAQTLVTTAEDSGGSRTCQG